MKKKKNKILKIIFISLGSFLALVLLILLIVPWLFKDEIKKVVDNAIAENVNATILYDVDDISLSMISSFPQLQFGIDHLTVKNHAPFEGDTLAHVGSFRIYVDVWDYLMNGQIVVREIALDAPQFHLKVNHQGIANYDIVKSDSTKKEAPSTSSSPLHLTLDKWMISKANLSYEDSTSQMFIRLQNLEQEGSATMFGDRIHTAVETNVPALFAAYGKIAYLRNHHLYSKINLEISEDYTRYTLKENIIKINDFAITTEGMFKMREDKYDMDLSFASKENTFKNVLSLVPSVYTSDFSHIKTNGTFSFSANAKGTYDSKAQTIPTFLARLLVKDGYLIYPGVDLPVERIALDVEASNKDGKTANTHLLLHNLSMQIANDPLRISGEVAQLNDFHLVAQGLLNLGNLKRVYPIEGMDMSGKMSFDVDSKGKLEDVNQGKYERINNRGNLSMEKVFIKKNGYPNTKIDAAIFQFDASSIRLNKADITVGKSDFFLQGTLSKYIEYALQDGTLQGDLSLKSNNIDLNEWMSNDSSSPKEAPKPSQEKEETPSPKNAKAYAIPKNLDLILKSTIGRVAVLNMPIDQFKGEVDLKNGVAAIKNSSFKMLEGLFLVNGAYDTKDADHPKFDFAMKAKQISVKKASTTFNSVQKLAPLAEHMSGLVDIDIQVAADIDGAYFPIYPTMNGAGKLYLQGTGIQEFKPLNELSNLVGIQELKNPTLKKTNVDFQIKNGRLFTQPLDMEIAGFKSSIHGFTSFDGGVDYAMDLKLPAKEINTLLKNSVNVDIGPYGDLLGEIPLSVNFKGKYNQIKPSFDKEKLSQSVQAQLKSIANKKINDSKKVAQETLKKTMQDLTNPNDKRDSKEKINSALEGGKKKLLDLLGSPK